MATPGLVTGNVVGSTFQNVDPQVQARQWELEDRDWALRKEADDKKYAAEMAAWQKGEQEAKMKAAYEKIYAPYMQSMWDMQQGKIGGVSDASNMISGDPRLGQGNVYKKYGSGLYGEQQNINVGQQPYEYRQDTNLTGDAYQQQLNDAYEMWKAGQMMGIGETKVTGTNSRLPGGSAGKSY